MARATLHDLFEIQTLFNEICAMLKEAGISLDGLFLNADLTGGPAWIRFRFV